MLSASRVAILDTIADCDVPRLVPPFPVLREALSRAVKRRVGTVALRAQGALAEAAWGDASRGAERVGARGALHGRHGRRAA